MTLTGCTVRRFEQLETSPETIEQELRPAVCERRQTDRLKENYSIDVLNSCTHAIGKKLNTPLMLLLITDTLMKHAQVKVSKTCNLVKAGYT